MRILLFLLLTICFQSLGAQTFYTSARGVTTEWTNVYQDDGLRLHESANSYWVVIDNGFTQRTAVFSKTIAVRGGSQAVGEILSMSTENATLNIRLQDNKVVALSTNVDGLKYNFANVLP